MITQECKRKQATDSSSDLTYKDIQPQLQTSQALETYAAGHRNSSLCTNFNGLLVTLVDNDLCIAYY